MPDYKYDIGYKFHNRYRGDAEFTVAHRYVNICPDYENLTRHRYVVDGADGKSQVLTEVEIGRCKAISVYEVGDILKATKGNYTFHLIVGKDRWVRIGQSSDYHGFSGKDGAWWYTSQYELEKVGSIVNVAGALREITNDLLS